MNVHESAPPGARIEYHDDDAAESASSFSSDVARFPLPSEIGTGFGLYAPVNENIGYGLLVIESARDACRLEVDAPGGWVKLTAHLSPETVLFAVDGEPGYLEVARNHGYLLSPDAHGIIRLQRDLTLREFSLFVRPDFLGRYYECSERDCCRGVAALLRSSANAPAWLRTDPGCRTRTAIEEVLTPPPMSRTIRTLYREAKLLEILSLKIAELEGVDVPKVCLSPCDRLHLEEARYILVSESASPPTIAQLARRVGLNTTKLKIGFKTLYGATPYTIVREANLGRALGLLKRGSHNVSEAAQAAGYSSLSAFSRAFQRRFGVLPRDVRR